MMEIVTVPLQVPKGLVPYLENAGSYQIFMRSAMMLYPFIQNLTISHGRAAELLGVHKFDLIAFYDRMGMPYLNQSEEELEEEIAGFARLKEKRAL